MRYCTPHLTEASRCENMRRTRQREKPYSIFQKVPRTVFAPQLIYRSRVELEIRNFIHELSSSVAETYYKIIKLRGPKMRENTEKHQREKPYSIFQKVSSMVFAP
jgi:hypothetical protein